MFGPRPGMPPQGREQRAARGQIPRPRPWRCTYLASLPISKATVSWSGWVGAAKIQLCRCRYKKCGSKSIIWWGKKLEHPSSFILHGPLAFLTPFLLLTPIPLPYPLSLFPSTLLCPDLRFPQNCRPPRTPASEVASASLFPSRDCIA